MNRFIFWSLLIGLPVLSLAASHDKHGRWDIQYERMQLVEVMENLAHTTGLSYELRSGAENIIDADFTASSLMQALQRLLADYNFITRRRGNTLHVVILGQKQASPAQPNVAMIKPQPPQKHELILRRQGSEPFITAGAINRRPVSLLIDTGASVVALSESLARKLGLRLGARQSVNTANGKTTGYSTVLSSLQLGEHLTLSKVQAVIIPGMEVGEQVLLGLNVLQRFELVQRHNELIIREH